MGSHKEVEMDLRQKQGQSIMVIGVKIKKKMHPEAHNWVDVMVAV